jgi:hypothetical protein
MAHTLEQFAADCHRILADPSLARAAAVCTLVAGGAEGEDFIATTWATMCQALRTLYEDPNLGFCILVNRGARPVHHTITVPIGRSTDRPGDQK